MRANKLVSMGLYQSRLMKLACIASAALLNFQSASFAGTQTEVHVSLLGQPCLIQGPFNESILKSIHSIGPAQIYPTLSLQNITSSLEQARKALEKIRSNTSLHSLLDRYREKLRKRLEAQITFMTALLQSQKFNQNSALIETAGRYLQLHEMQTFERLAKKTSPLEKPGEKTTRLNSENLEAMFDLFNEAIEPDPEGEFHRAIKKLGIQYKCSFEENDDATSE
jgi:hypothetical protein